MAKTINFEIENVELVREDPDSSFSVLSLDFFASGPNKHDLYVSEETLLKTADTIKNKPLVWKYDSRLDDAYTHDSEEAPCGFVPESASITSRKLPDGRTMLSVISYVWKKYSGKILDIFRRDGDKPVSVEMSVLATADRSDGLTELLDYTFEAVTILGSFITPAIPLAHATVLQFAREYEEAFRQEFGRYEEVDFLIPEEVKTAARQALDLRKQHRVAATAAALAVARHLAGSDKASPEKIRQIAKRRPKASEDPFSEASISNGLYGGEAGYRWAGPLAAHLDELDQRTVSYFEDTGVKKSDQKEEHHSVIEEKTQLNQEFPEEEKPVEKVEMAETPAEEKKEDPEEEKSETPEEEKKEEMAVDYAAFAALFAGDEEFAAAKVECAKPACEMNYGVILNAMYAKFCKMEAMYNRMSAEKEEMAAKFAEAEEKSKAFLSEFEALKAFKAEKDQQEFQFAVDATLKSIEEKTQIPVEELDALRAKAQEFGLDNLDAWRNLAKARGLDFAAKEAREDGIKRYGLPFAGEARKNPASPWSR